MCPPGFVSSWLQEGLEVGADAVSPRPYPRLHHRGHRDSILLEGPMPPPEGLLSAGGDSAPESCPWATMDGTWKLVSDIPVLADTLATSAPGGGQATLCMVSITSWSSLQVWAPLPVWRSAPSTLCQLLPSPAYFSALLTMHLGSPSRQSYK